MARTEARLSVSIWDDGDFLALSPGAQRMFMFLISQPDLAHDGVIALRIRRWSKKAAGLSIAQITADLNDLSTSRFVVMDEDTEELLVRSFIRRDRIYRQPNVFMAAADHLDTVSSPRILTAVAAELKRIEDGGDLPEGSRKAFDKIAAAAKGSGNPSPGGPDGESPSADDTAALSDGASITPGRKGSANPSPNPSGKGSRLRPGERGVVTAVSSASPFPVPRAPSPVPRELAPLAPPALAALDAVEATPELFVVTGADIAEPEPENAGQLTRQWIDYCAKNNLKLTGTAIKRYGRHIKSALAQGFEIPHIKFALAQMLRDRVASRPALLDNYLIRVQQGPEMPPERMSQHQADAERRAAAEGTTAADRLRETLTRPA